jgi:hypothetical protein
LYDVYTIERVYQDIEKFFDCNFMPYESVKKKETSDCFNDAPEEPVT